jgi:hypothetical protein
VENYQKAMEWGLVSVIRVSVSGTGKFMKLGF